MTIRRVALVFDNRPRPETTGTYCFRALQELVEIRHVLPEDVAQVSPDEFDLWLRIDDGLRFPWPSTARPCAYWAIDTHLDFAWSHDQARRFDFVFAAQRDGAQRLREEGCAVAQWLPLACDPAIHHPHETGKQWDVGFVGHVLGGERERLLQLIQSRFPNCFVGQRYFEEMAQVYSASRIVFNRSVAGDLNMRVFEALACGTLLLTDDLGGNGQADLFQDGVHLATYCRDEDLIDQLTRYLEDEAARERVAEAGHREVLARHTYRHRMRTLLEHTEHESRRATGLSIAPQPLTAGPDGESPADGGARDGRGSGDPKGSTAPEASGVRPAKEASYFEFSRPEVLRLVPASARCVLDIGCGAGRLGESLKRRQPAEVVGIERDEPAARRPLRLRHLRRHPRTPPRSGTAPGEDPPLARARRPARRQHSQRPAPQRRPRAVGGKLDVRGGRPAGRRPRPLFHPPRDREALGPQPAHGRGLAGRPRPRRRGPAGPRALESGRRGRLPLSGRLV